MLERILHFIIDGAKQKNYYLFRRRKSFSQGLSFGAFSFSGWLLDLSSL